MRLERRGSFCGFGKIAVAALLLNLGGNWLPALRADEANQAADPAANLNALQSAATPAERTKLATAIRAQLEKSKLAEEDLALLIGLAETLERLRMDEPAQDLYKLFAPRLLASDGQGHKQIGELMTGALKRLGCVGKPFTLAGQTCDGQRFDIASLRGKVALIVFWSTAHQESLEELLHVRRLQRDFSSRGLAVVGVSGDGDRATLDRFMLQIAMPWPTLNDPQAGPLQPAIKEYGISTFPTTFLIGKDGKVLAMNVRGRELRRQIIGLLGLPEARPIVSAGPQGASTVNDMAERILDVGEQWIKEGKVKNGQQLLADGFPASAAGGWAPPRKQPIGDEELYQQALESVFVLGTLFRVPENPQWQVSTATAFAVTPDGVLSTSAHVFDFENWEMGAMIAFNSAGQAFPVEQLLAADGGGDTCLLRIKAKNLRPLSLAQGTPVGARVRVVSHPGSSVYYLSSGHVASYEADEQGIPWMHITAQFGEGSSGAPVFDQFGNVAGQVSQTSTLFSTPQGEPQKHHAARGFAASPPRRPTRQAGPMHGAAAEPQMVFRLCTPAARLEKLFSK